MGRGLAEETLDGRQPKRLTWLFTFRDPEVVILKTFWRDIGLLEEC